MVILDQSMESIIGDNDFKNVCDLKLRLSFVPSSCNYALQIALANGCVVIYFSACFPLFTDHIIIIHSKV